MYDAQGKLQCKKVKVKPQVIKQEAQTMTCLLYPTSRPLLNNVDADSEHGCPWFCNKNEATYNGRWDYGACMCCKKN